VSKAALICATIFAAIACDAPLPDARFGRGSALREELHTVAAGDALFPAARAVAAVIPRGYLRGSPDGRLHVHAPALRKAEQLCEGEPFADQPSAAACTAVLIDDNLIATAGHCFKHAWDCQNYRFVFGYAYGSNGGSIRVEPGDVYECERARVQQNDRPRSETVHDYAIVELTRPVRDRAVVKARRTPPMSGEVVTIVSATGGVPLKIERGARVTDTRAAFQDYFILNSQTYSGSSGAPILDASGALLGVYVRGGEDYRWDASSACNRVRLRDGSEAVRAHSRGSSEQRGTLNATATGRQDEGSSTTSVPEQASYLRPAVEALCSTGYPSLRLCGLEPVCGDGICSPGETVVGDCLQDCRR
jgi:V8-like Glu-specific endopeptidase